MWEENPNWGKAHVIMSVLKTQIYMQGSGLRLDSNRGPKSMKGREIKLATQN